MTRSNRTLDNPVEHQKPSLKKILAILAIISLVSIGAVYAAFNIQVNIPVTVTSPPAQAHVISAILSNSTVTIQCGTSANLTCPDPQMIVGQSLNLTVTLKGTPKANVVWVSAVPLYLTMTVIQAPPTLDGSGNGVWIWNIYANSPSAGSVSTSITLNLETPAGQP